MEGRIDVAYTNGVIAVREKHLLKDKIFRMCELNADEAFRLLVESGFGGGAETTASVYEFEKLIAVEEEKLDAFIREYAPSQAESAYLLSPRDFHNAKALVKAKFTGESAEKMLTREGLIAIDTLRECVESGDYSILEKLCSKLKAALEEVAELPEEERTGARLGAIFEMALFAHLHGVTRRKKHLRKLLTAKADMTNILTALRADDQESAEAAYLPYGKISKKALETLFTDRSAFSGAPYTEFTRLCLDAKEKGLPFTQAEKLRDGYDAAYFSERKYALEKTEPFLYYVYRRKTECMNVRIALVCLLAGVGEQDIKNRLRAF